MRSNILSITAGILSIAISSLCYGETVCVDDMAPDTVSGLISGVIVDSVTDGEVWFVEISKLSGKQEVLIASKVSAPNCTTELVRNLLDSKKILSWHYVVVAGSKQVWKITSDNN